MLIRMKVMVEIHVEALYFIFFDLLKITLLKHSIDAFSHTFYVQFGECFVAHKSQIYTVEHQKTQNDHFWKDIEHDFSQMLVIIQPKFQVGQYLIMINLRSS